MSSRAKRNKNSEHQTTSTQAASEFPVSNSPSHEEIRRRAYEIYIERGEQPGTELDNWLQAEHELERGVLSHAQAGQEADSRHGWLDEQR